jgi:membrane protein DedA with SNARE-associated domain
VAGLFAWITGLPAALLYLVLALIAALENVVPPLPTDTVVAFGTWLAVRGQASAVVAFLCIWLGNVAGGAAMYAVGRRHGVTWMHRHFPSLADERGEARLLALYARYGVLALVVSRFIPGVRAVVPPFAGALRLPAVSALGAMAVASAIWYGLISYLAYRAGANWSTLTATVVRSGRSAAFLGVGGVVVAAIVAAVWMLRRRARTAP